MNPDQLSCKICDNATDNNILKVREMYFGTREIFNYLKCSNCGCLQLMNQPRDFSVHYPKDYFTFQQSHEGKLKAFLNRYRDRSAMGENTFLGDLLLKKFGEPAYVSRIKNAGVGLKNTILDVGCGKGILLHKMKESGFENILGIDPFLDESINYKNGLKILKKDFIDIEDQFDFIMFNHSFEHMGNPFEIIKHSNKILKKGKFLLIRIPVADSFAFNKYKENWCSLDAPRHLYLHTEKSIKILAENSDFQIKKINYDSRSWQFWGSEQYSKDIALMNEKSYFINPDNSIFTKKEIEDYEKQTIVLNKNKEGDQAEFYLQKIN
jgi:SAM-dependent methyltransferase